MMGVFGTHAPDYQAHDIVVFPTGGPDGKKPAVKNYPKIGRDYSAKLARNPKFADSNIGFMCGPRNQITVLDVDTPDLAFFKWALNKCGETPIKIQTASGKYQAWYRHGGELRKIRPIEGKEIDILGGGLCIAPPSVRADKGGKAYRFLDGCLDDVHRLPIIRPGALPPEVYSTTTGGPRTPSSDMGGVQEGRRNNTLFSRCLCDLKDGYDTELIPTRALAWNEGFVSPLPETEVLKTAASAVRYHLKGNNWNGGGGVFQLTRTEFEKIGGDADAMCLLACLRFNHGSRIGPFCIVSRAMERHGVIRGWGHNKYEAATKRLEKKGMIVCVERKHGNPSQFTFPDKVPCN